MKPYLDSLRYILENGETRPDRTGTGTISVFGTQTRYALRSSFPAVTTKKLAWKAVVSELLWFLEGSTDERRLAEILHGTRSSEKTTIWTLNANSDYWKGNAKFVGDLGNIYSKQWRDFGGVDQLSTIIEGIKKDPFGRRHIVSAWNPPELESMSLPPCHVMFQFHVNTNKELSCQMYQRSQDVFLGGPFNIASYSLLTHMIAHVCGLRVGEFIHVSGDSHIYLNQVEQVNEQLKREPFAPPTLWLNPEITDIFKFTMEDIKLVNYQSHPALTAPMAV